MTTTAPTSYPIYPGNDKTFQVGPLSYYPAGTVTKTPLITGTMTGFLATTDGDTETAADPSLVPTCVHVTGDETGLWRVDFDDAVLDPAVTDPLFAATPTACFLILIHDSGLRFVVPLVYTPARPAELK
jgi:hypothetical protein